MKTYVLYSCPLYIIRTSDNRHKSQNKGEKQMKLFEMLYKVFINGADTNSSDIRVFGSTMTLRRYAKNYSLPAYVRI